MPAGIATFVSGSVNNALNTFVTNTSAAIAAGISPLVVIGLTIWAITYGMATMRQEVNEPIMGFAKYFLKVSLILGIALSSGVYQGEVVQGVYSFTNWMVSVVAPGTNGDIFKVIDDFDQKVSELGLVIIGHGMTLLPMGGWLDLVAGLLVLLGSAVMIIVVLGFSLVATVAVKFMLGIGPMFIASLCFPPIAKFFEAWMGKIMNYSFLMIGLAVTTSMGLVIVGAYVSHFSESQDATNAIADAVGLIVAEGALGILVWQMPNIAAGLGGGSAISGGGLGAFIGGLIAGRMSNGKEEKGGSDKGGGSVEDKSESSNSERGPAGGGGGRTPAYRRATLDRLEYTKYKDAD